MEFFYFFYHIFSKEAKNNRKKKCDKIPLNTKMYKNIPKTPEKREKGVILKYKTKF